MFSSVVILLSMELATLPIIQAGPACLLINKLKFPVLSVDIKAIKKKTFPLSLET